MLLRRAGLTASAGLSCVQLTPRRIATTALMRLLNTLTHSLTILTGVAVDVTVTTTMCIKLLTSLVGKTS